MSLDTIAIHADQLLTMPEDAPALQNYDSQGDLEARDRAICGLLEDAGVFVKDGVINWYGPWDERPDEARGNDVSKARAGVVTPGWVECHTHSVFAGDRADEFVLRNAGRSYSDILEAGGGILNSVDAVREASVDELAQSLLNRVFEFVRKGVTTLEVKSGYGLSLEDELKMLRAIDRVRDEDVPCELVSCFMGAHTVPRDFKDDREGYVDLICNEMIPAVAEEDLADYCDVFCDRGAFTVSEAERVLMTGKGHDMTPRIHAEQLSDSGGAMMAAELGASSADHLEHVSKDALKAMANSDVTAVVLPAVNVFLGTTDQLAPARQALKVGCEVALSTDFNPGTAMTQDLGMVMNLACNLHQMTPGEALRGVTIGAAKAMDRDDIGRIRRGEPANLTMLNAPHYQYIPYHVGTNHVSGVIQNGSIGYWTNTEG
jgi:imidazolonepropionase